MKKLLVCWMIPIQFLAFHTSAQNVVSGTVRSTGGELLPGVTVKLLQSTFPEVLTDENGRYQINFAPNVELFITGKLLFTSIGFTSKEVPISSRSRVDVILEPVASKLEDVVVIGYGSQSREKITTSVSKLDNKVLANAAIANVGTALQGTIPGLRVINTSGQPGNSPNIILRGGASINAPGGPLVVVDGIVREMADLNPSDIESVTVLKDAAATAIYGARANNGVILITTYKGKSGVSEVTYKVRTGFNFQRNAYERLNARDYLYYTQVGFLNTHLSRVQGELSWADYLWEDLRAFDVARITDANRQDFQTYLGKGWEWMINPYNNTDTLVFKDHSGEMDFIFNNKPFTQDHYLSFSGGNDKGKFVAGLGYYNEEGLVIGTKYERFSGNFNGSYKIKDNLEISSGVTVSNSKRPPLYTSEITLFYYLEYSYPVFRAFNEDGSPNSGAGPSYGNPLYYLDKNIRKNDARKAAFNVGVKWEIVKGLTLSGQANIYYTDVITESFNKQTQLATSTVPNSTRLASSIYDNTFQQQHNVTLDYRKNYGKHHINVLAGGEFFDIGAFNLSATGQGAPTDDVYTLNAAVVRNNISSTRTDFRILSGFGRLNYDYDGKYLLTAVARYDGVSSLADNRWGAFPGVSVGWNIHQEDFFRGSNLSKFISVIKPRFSYGISGNIAGVGNYEVQGEYRTLAPYGNSASYLNTAVINRGLRWEKSRSVQIGADIGLLNNKVMMVVDYFRRTTVDLLTNLTLPTYTGFNSIRTNLGNLLNEGFEVDINANVLRLKSGLTWDVGFNASFVKNRILKLPFNNNEKNRQDGFQVFDPATGKVIWVGGYQEGGRVGDLYAFKQERILRDWDDVNQTVPDRYDAIAELYGPVAFANLASKEGKFPIEPGDVLWADLDNNNIINSLDRVYMGNIYPKWTGGFSTTLSYKNFSIYGRFDGAFGHMIVNRRLMMLLGQASSPLSVEVKNMWTPENPNADLAKNYNTDQVMKKNMFRSYLDGGAVDPSTGSSRFYEKGDYMALREITISYLFPQSLISRLRVSSLRANITGQNLAYFTKYSGNAPENGGVDAGRYPLPRTLIFGLQVSF